MIEHIWEKAPFFRAFWIAKLWLVAGSYPFAENVAEGEARLRTIIAGGVRIFINLTTPGELNNAGIPLVDYTPYAQTIAEEFACTLELRQFPIQDGGIPATRELKDILRILRRSEGHEQMTYLHCWGGRGRTATVIACWLVSRNRMTGEEAIAVLQNNLNFNAAGPWNYPRYGGPLLETEIQTQYVKQFGLSEAGR